MLNIILFSIIGFILSLYAYFVEQKLHTQATYQPACDINDKVSCSKAFQSPYRKFLNVSNSIWGMLFYTILIIAAFLDQTKLVFGLTVLSGIVTAYLAYILYVKIRSACAVCTSIYIVNIILLILAYRTL